MNIAKLRKEMSEGWRAGEFQASQVVEAYDEGYAAAIEDAIYCLEEAKGYTVDFNKHMDYAIDAIKTLLSRECR